MAIILTIGINMILVWLLNNHTCTFNYLIYWISVVLYAHILLVGECQREMYDKIIHLSIDATLTRGGKNLGEHICIFIIESQC